MREFIHRPTVHKAIKSLTDSFHGKTMIMERKYTSLVVAITHFPINFDVCSPTNPFAPPYDVVHILRQAFQSSSYFSIASHCFGFSPQTHYQQQSVCTVTTIMRSTTICCACQMGFVCKNTLIRVSYRTTCK